MKAILFEVDPIAVLGVGDFALDKPPLDETTCRCSVFMKYYLGGGRVYMMVATR